MAEGGSADDVPEISAKLQNVSEVTSSHVKLSEPVFPPRMGLVKVGSPLKINCDLLIYYKPNTSFLKLHVYLIPRDPALRKELDQREVPDGYTLLLRSHPEKSLKIRDRFVLTADLDGAEICPETLMLRYESRTPNFFEVFIEKSDKDLTLKLTQENEHQAVWTCVIQKDEYQTTGHTQGGPSRSLEPQICESITQGASDWTKLEPKVSSTDADEAPTYSLQSEAGNFECSVSSLRWVCKEKVSFTYQFCSWKPEMESKHYTLAGPLIDITVIAGKLDEVHLPHCICMDDNPEILDNIAVLHIDDCGDEVEKVSEVTSSHVKLSEPEFSPRAVLMKAGLPVKINCNVLIYKTNTASPTLHVYLVPRDPALQEAVDRMERSRGYKVIQKPHPMTLLKMCDRFILTADLDHTEISPETLMLRYQRMPNFFEVFIENPDEDLTLTLTQENEHQPVWSCVIGRDELQSTGQTPDEPSGSSEVEESILQVSSDWTKLEPEVSSTEGDADKTYSLQSEAGSFECSVSSMRWVCKEEVSFKYQFCSSEKDMERIQCKPAGRLMDITVIDGKLDEVYLPHWIRIDDNPKTLDIAALHIDDRRIVVEKGSEFTWSHVKLSEPVSCQTVGPVKFGSSVEWECNVLIYKTTTESLKLHVYLIPDDSALKQEVHQTALSDGYKVIRKPNPEKTMKMHDRFILTADLDGAEICPEDLKLRSRNPNFFEVFIENPVTNFNLKLTQEKEHQPVWTCAIRKDDYQCAGHIKEKHSVDDHESAQMQKEEVVKGKLLGILEDLEGEEFEDFKWHLVNSNIGSGLERITKCKLEGSRRPRVVDLMWETYVQQSEEVTTKVLEKMKKKNLVKKLQDTS